MKGEEMAEAEERCVNQDGPAGPVRSIGTEHRTALKGNELLIQKSDHSFVDRATEFGVTDPYRRGRQVTSEGNLRA